MLTPVCVYHPMARMCGYVCRPYDVKNPYLAPLTVNRELHKGGDRSCMHIELDISESKIRWGFISASVLEWENMTGTGLLILSVLSRSSCLIKKIEKNRKVVKRICFCFFTWCDLFWAANPAYKSHCTAAPFRGFIHEQESRTLPVKGQYAGCSGRVLCWAVSMVSCLPWLLSHKLSSIFFVKG